MKLRQFIPVLIITASIWAYRNSLQGPFIFDDLTNIVENPTIRCLWPIGKALSPPATAALGGRPVINLSLSINYALGRNAVWGYHALNLAIHILASLTLLGFVRRTLLRPVLKGRFENSAPLLALAITVVWAIHPLQTAAVTYLSERSELLMGLFYLLTLYCFARGTESKRSGFWFTLCVVACLLGMGTKEAMVTAPLLVLLYDRAFVSGNFQEAWTRHRHLYLGLAGSWLLLGYLMTGLHGRCVGYGMGITWWGYALTECRAVVHYLRLALWPHPLVFDYGFYVATWHLAAVAPSALILTVLATAVLFELRRHPAIGFVGAWFFVILAPTSTVVPIVGSPIAEHRMYLPLASVVTLAAVGAFEIGKRLFHKQQGVVLGWVAGGSVVVLFTSLTIQRNQDYESVATIWQDTVDKCPNNPRAHFSLGVALQQAGRLQEAIGHYEQAVRLQPDYVEAHNNLGIALVQLGRAQEAIGYWEEALRVKPDHAESHNNLGNALLQAGKVQEAIGHYEQAVRIKSDYADAHCGLGVALEQAGRLQEAIGHWEQALRINPDCAEAPLAHYNLGITLMGQGKLQEAVGHYEQALRIKPGYAEAHYNMGLALEKLGRRQEAIGHYEQALRIKPDFARAQNALALARAIQ